MAWSWSGWYPCKQDIFHDKYETGSFFHSGRNVAEERFWRKYIHNDGSYMSSDGSQGRHFYSLPSSRGWSGASSMSSGSWPRTWNNGYKPPVIEEEEERVTDWRYGDKIEGEDTVDKKEDKSKESMEEWKEHAEQDDDENECKKDDDKVHVCNCCHCRERLPRWATKEQDRSMGDLKMESGTIPSGGGESIRTNSRKTITVA